MLSGVIVSPEVMREHHERVLEALSAHDAQRASAVVDEYLGRGNQTLDQLATPGVRLQS
jgi:DNA-binding GntR family transcriptional regulator